MSSPDILPRPRVVLAPDGKTSSPSSSLSASEVLRQSPLSETSLTPSIGELLLTAENLQADQNDASPVGLLAQSLGSTTELGQRLAIQASEIVKIASGEESKSSVERRRKLRERTGYIPSLAGGQESKGGTGRGDFSWRRDLSENGQKLWHWLARDMADKDVMPEIAAKEGWNWEAAVDELRRHNLLDESDPKRVKLIRGQ